MAAARPVITLLTDFGDRDHFVASMKGVILSIHPDARLVDLSHHVTPYQISEAAHLLTSCYRYFPEGTVHVAVVDPGVGSARRPLLVTTSRYRFVGPDNGLFTPVLMEEERVEVRRIENARYRLEAPGQTFHGRDVFAPAAAWLSRGEPPDAFGPLVHDPVRLPLGGPVWEGARLIGSIVAIDRFGNLISDLTARHLAQFEEASGRAAVTIRVGETSISGLVRNYSEGPPEQPAALINSNGFLEVFVKEGHAAALCGIQRGAAVRLESQGRGQCTELSIRSQT